MTKPFSRLVSLFIVPCLLADPFTTFASNSPGTFHANQAFFRQEAIVSPVVTAAKSILHKTTARTVETRMVEALVPARVLVRTRERQTWPGPTGEYGNPGMALPFPADKELEGKNNKAFFRNLLNDRLYSGDINPKFLQFIFTEYHHFEGQFLKFEDKTEGKPGPYLLGKMSKHGPIVLRPQRDNILRVTVNSKKLMVEVSDLHQALSEKYSHEVAQLLKAFRGALAARGLQSSDLAKAAPYVNFEIREQHDFYGEKDLDSPTIIITESMLEARNEAGLVGIMIEELGHVLTGKADAENLPESLLAWMKHVDARAFMEGLSVLWADISPLRRELIGILDGGEYKSMPPEVLSEFQVLIAKLFAINMLAARDWTGKPTMPDGRERMTWPAPVVREKSLKSFFTKVLLYKEKGKDGKFVYYSYPHEILARESVLNTLIHQAARAAGIETLAQWEWPPSTARYVARVNFALDQNLGNDEKTLYEPTQIRIHPRLTHRGNKKAYLLALIKGLVEVTMKYDKHHTRGATAISRQLLAAA